MDGDEEERNAQDGKEPVSQMVSCRGAGRIMRKEGLINIGKFWCSVLVSDLANVSHTIVTSSGLLDHGGQRLGEEVEGTRVRWSMFSVAWLKVLGFSYSVISGMENQRPGLRSRL